MEAACLFAQRLQVEQIIAVSNETHIYRSLRYRDKEGKIHADYNAFWESVSSVSMLNAITAFQHRWREKNCRNRQ